MLDRLVDAIDTLTRSSKVDAVILSFMRISFFYLMWHVLSAVLWRIFIRPEG